MSHFTISTVPIDPAALASTMQNDASGAFVAFEGRVRDHNEGRAVAGLSYEVFHALALSEGEKILADAIQAYGLTNAQCVHREGDLAIGDCAVWVGVTAAHRGEAFAACRAIIDDIKHRLPIWKRETYRDGTIAWVNCQHNGYAHHAHSDLEPLPEATAYYDRQLRLPEIGEAGQRKLGNARVLIVGIGGLGSAAALCLAGAGIGTIGLAEADTLDISNLHRQLLYDAVDAGKKKTALAAARLHAHNPLIDIVVHETRVSAVDAESLFGAYDLVLDCTDNFAAKYLLNDASCLTATPLIQASIHRNEGHILTIDPASRTGCLRCIWPAPPPPQSIGSCAEIGVLGTVPVIFGALQANEAIRHFLQLPCQSTASLITFDLQTLRTAVIARRRDTRCTICGDHAEPIKLQDDTSYQYAPRSGETIQHLAIKFQLIDLREPDETAAQQVPGAVNLPYSGFNPAAVQYPADTNLLLLCATGKRSAAAAVDLRNAGWLNAFSLAGGLTGLATGRQAA